MPDEVPPAWDGRGNDPWMPERLAAFLDAAMAEARMFRSFLGFLRDWITLVRDRMRESRYDQSVIPALIPAWWDAMNEYTERDIMDTMNQGYESVTGEPYSLDTRALAVNRALQRRNQLVRVADEVYSLVQREVAKAVNIGTSGEDLAAIIEDLFDFTGTPRWDNRAAVVARTETIGALNGGRFDGHQSIAGRLGGAFERVWVATTVGPASENTRPSHLAADGQRAALDGVFIIGDPPSALRFPGDPAGPPHEVIQCRCTTILVRPGQDLNLARRA